jgi:site-specific recombinase XerD
MQGRVEHKIVTEKKIQSLIKEYPEYLKKFYYSLNSKTHMTKLRYVMNVIRFLNYYGKGEKVREKDLNNIEAFDIESYIQDINYIEDDDNIKEMSSSTKACIYSSINAFMTFLKYNKYIKENPFESTKIERPKIQENDVVFLTPEEVKLVEEAILNGVGNARSKGKQKNWKYRDMLLFRIPVVNGLRVTALSEIDISDINFKKNTIKVTEKGNITKEVFIDNKTKEYIVKWLCDRKDLLDGDLDRCKALFISNRKERMSISSIEDVIEKYTKETIKDKHITPHKLRSTCGTNIYQHTKDIYLVANVLGHKSTSPTKRYAKIFEEDKQNAINEVANLY